MRVAVGLGWLGLALYGGWLGTQIEITPDHLLYKVGAGLYALLIGLTFWVLLRGRTQ